MAGKTIKPISQARGALLSSAVLAALGLLAGGQAQAASCPTGTGADLYVDHAWNGNCTLTGGGTLTVTEAGSVQPDNNPGIAVILDGGAAISNLGHIVGNGAVAIVNSFSSMTTLYNGGTIEGRAGGSAITIGMMGSIATLTNEGTIIGTSTEPDVGAITNFHTIGTLNNSGTIRGTGGIAILNDYGGAIGSITNSGVIDGDVLLGAFSLDNTVLKLEGSNSRIIGKVTGRADVTVNGRFATEGDFHIMNFTVANSGVLTLGHKITVSEMQFKNQGTVRILAGQTGSIVGNYFQSSGATLAIGVDSQSSHGTLDVTGSAHFEPGAKLAVAVSPGNTLANGQVMTVIKATGGVTADNDALVVSDDSELFNFQAVVNAHSVNLMTVADGGGDPASPGGGPVSNRVQAQGFSQGLGAARVLDGFITSTSNAGDMVNVVNALGQLHSQAEVSRAVAQTLPLMSASMNQVVLDGMRGVNNVIQSRQADVAGVSSGEGFLTDQHLWFKPLASYADQNDRNGVAGYRAHTYGFVLGGDANVGQSSTLGLAFAYARTSIDGKSTASDNRADIDAYQLIAYGSHGLAALPNVEVNWQADAGINRNDGRRHINFGGLDRTAKSDFDSVTSHLGAGIGRGFALGENTRFTPELRADYFHIRSEAHKETDADALNLKVNAQTSEQLIAMLEGRLRHQLNNRMALLVDLGVGYDLLGENNDITASYVGGGAAFQTPGLDAGRWVGRAGLGLQSQAGEGLRIAARYDLETRSGLLAQTASVNLRWAF